MQTCSGAVIPISGEQSSSLWQEDLGGGYVAATVCRLGTLILARLHAGHLTEAELFPACTHTHSRSVSIMTTGATALLIQNTHHRFHSPTGGYVTYVYSNNSSLFFFFTLHSISLFSTSRTGVYSAGSLFEWWCPRLSLFSILILHFQPHSTRLLKAGSILWGYGD